MQEGTRLKLEKLRRLLKAEPQPMTMERAEELFRKAFPKVKDTGKIIPGHGGLLDRIDGMIFVFPIFYLIMIL